MSEEYIKASRLGKEAAIVALVAFLVASVFLIAPADADGQTFDQEVTGYGYYPHIELVGLTQTEYVIWDFDDGSEPERVDVTAENPNAGVDHKFPAIGDYYVKATLYNTYDDGSGEQQGVTTKILLYHIMGYPVVTFDSMGGSDVDPYTGTSSSYVMSEENRPEDPTKAGHTFTGWYKDADCTQPFTFGTDSVKEHITLYAGWDAIEYTVHFDLGEVEGTAPQDQKVDYGKLIQQPENPVDSSEDARTFLGWYFEDALWSFTSPVEGDMTLVAHWSEPGVEYVTVTFDGNGGTAGQSSMPAEIGQEIELPSATRDGFTFDGWFDGDEKVGDAGDKYTVEAAVTLTAHWTEVTTPGEDDDEDDGNEDNFWFLVGAIVCGVLAVICLALGPRTNWYSVIGTAVLVIVAAVCLLFYFEVM